MLFSEPKIPQYSRPARTTGNDAVSVLFSEPKIPQFCFRSRRCFGSLAVFQCSSASRKFLNRDRRSRQPRPTVRFSALQRAENSSIHERADGVRARAVFQCSSASRKFLNGYNEMGQAMKDAFQCSSASRKFLNERSRPACDPHAQRFSALQRAENSSIVQRLHRRG